MSAAGFGLAYWRSKRPDLVKIFDELLDISACNCSVQGMSNGLSTQGSDRHFTQNCGSTVRSESAAIPGLASNEFIKAMSKANPRLHRRQVTALWEGLINGTGQSYVNLDDFCLCVCAGEESDDALAEFADVSVDMFGSLKRPFLSKQHAITNLLAFLRALHARELVMNGMLTNSADSRIQQVAIRDGESVIKAGMSDSRDADVCKALPESIASETHSNHISSSSSGLEAAEFGKRIKEAHPRLCRAQVRALWDGLTIGTGRANVALEDFWECQKAGQEGDEALAEFADMFVHTFTSLGYSTLSKETAVKNLHALLRSLTERHSVETKKGNATGAAKVYDRENKFAIASKSQTAGKSTQSATSSSKIAATPFSTYPAVWKAPATIAKGAAEENSRKLKQDLKAKLQKLNDMGAFSRDERRSVQSDHNMREFKQQLKTNIQESFESGGFTRAMSSAPTNSCGSRPSSRHHGLQELLGQTSKVRADLARWREGWEDIGSSMRELLDLVHKLDRAKTRGDQNGESIGNSRSGARANGVHFSRSPSVSP
jgi:hypothetical protein